MNSNKKGIKLNDATNTKFDKIKKTKNSPN